MNESLLVNDASTSVVSIILAYGFLQLVSKSAAKGYLDPKLSRKILHTLALPLYMILWPFYSAIPAARFFAVLVPALNIIRLTRAATTLATTERDDENRILAMAVSRSGDASEATGGPMIYLIIATVLLLLAGPHSPIVIVALSNLAAGDGCADIFGRWLGKDNQWPMLEGKSVAGTVAFAASAALCSVGLLYWNLIGPSILPGASGILEPTLSDLSWIGPVTGVALVTAFAELLPGVDDNYTVPTVSGLLMWYWLSYSL
jgi:phytol kinase